MAAAGSALAGKHWVYLDAQRTHEVHAQVAQVQSQGYLVTTEFPMGSREPGEMVQAQTPIAGEDELTLLLRELEERLALGGTYYRTDSAELKWSQLPPPSRPLDLRAHEAPIPGLEATGGRMRFHHFHGESGEKDRLLIAMPRPGMSGRHILAQVDFAFPRVDEGALQVLHTRLAAPLLQSAVAKAHVEAPRKGFRKLFEPKDYEEAYGDGWVDRARAMFSRAATRLVASPAPAPEARALPRHPAPTQLDEMRAALASPRVETLKLKYVDPQTEAVLVGGGEHTVRKFIAGLRKKLPHQHSYDISVLEAALLCEYAIPSKMWDLASEEGAKLLRYTHGYA